MAEFPAGIAYGDRHAIRWAYAAMIPQVIRDVASFLAAGVLCLLPLAEQRELPCSLCDGPIVTAAYADRFPLIAVVESWVEFHLIKGSSRKQRNDSDAVRPAWNSWRCHCDIRIPVSIGLVSHGVRGCA